MHLVCLGVVRRMLQFLKKGDRVVRLCSRQILNISENLLELRKYIPSEFARRPRGLIELDRWKATEFRQFLLYTGQVTLKSILKPDLYKHFLTLSVAVTILLSHDKDKRVQYLEYAQKLLEHYVRHCQKFYGDNFVVYNVHNLLHLADDVRFFNLSLDEISAFSFENFFQTLKKYVRTPKNPLVQVAKRIEESENIEHIRKGNIKLKQREWRLSTLPRDSIVLLKNNTYAQIIEVRTNGYFCCLFDCSYLQPFFIEPCSSALVGIYYSENRHKHTKTKLVTNEDIAKKGLKLPCEDGYVLMPFLHCNE
ncbi:uncharacterized protein LOC124816529 isoform X1 [Hydra vulgaris]|uniref:uncharacterized protein LOC124816529 isoform X1 n=1 Tax=Hydra vulgaris TaxID=6087 RepID=UPI0032EA437E